MGTLKKFKGQKYVTTLPAALHQRTTQQLTIVHAEGISNERRRWGGISSWLHSTVKPQTAIIQRIYIFSQGHAAVFKQSSFLSGMLFREMITIKGSLIHSVFFWFLHPSSSLPNLKDHLTSEHQSIEGFFLFSRAKPHWGSSQLLVLYWVPHQR